MSYTYFKPDDFHKNRAEGIGSSDVPIIAGLTAKWGDTPLKLWMQKTGREEGFAGNVATEFGNLHENSILYYYIKENYSQELAEKFLIHKITGKSFSQFKTNTEARHKELPYFIAHADLVVDDGETLHIQEAKSTRLMSAKRGGDENFGYSVSDKSENGIPLSVYLQVQFQMLCYGADTAGVSLLCDTSDYREYGIIKPNAKTQNKIAAMVKKFWWHVQNDTPPKPMTPDDVAKLFPEVKDESVIVPLDMQLGKSTLLEMLDERERLDKRAKEIKSKIDDIKLAVGLLLKDNRVLQTPDGQVIATATTTNRRSLSIKDIEREKKIYEEVEKLGLVKTSEVKTIRFRSLK